MEISDGIVLVDKPVGWSSFKAVAILRRQLSVRAGHKVKVGHAGTLDPFATGLLILLVGKACKEAGAFLKLDKTYEVTAVLGQRSTTGDPEGELLPVSTQRPNRDQVIKALAGFEGEISQTPPAFSAIKINGVRAYKLARQGSEVVMSPRRVIIHHLTLQDYTYPQVTFVCNVSSGTYIRSLVQDIGDILGAGAYTSALRRTTIGDYRVDKAITLTAAEDTSR